MNRLECELTSSCLPNEPEKGRLCALSNMTENGPSLRNVFKMFECSQSEPSANDVESEQVPSHV